MTRMKASDFDQRLLEIYDGYAHGLITKRDFLEQASKYAIGGATAAGLLKALSPDYALAAQVSENDPAIRSEALTFASPDGHGSISGLLVRPASAGTAMPVVLVIHENRGLNPYIEDVARRLGKAGYMALAPDGLSPLGGYPGTDEEGKKMQRSMDPTKLLQDFFAGFEHLLKRKDSTGKAGAVGFCYGGGVCNALAVAYPELAASVPFYGRQADADDVPRIKAPLLLHYAGLDNRINQGWPAYEDALKKHGKEFAAHFYPGVNHGFHNDTTPRYDQAAAELAWQRTLAFFKAKLS